VHADAEAGESGKKSGSGTPTTGPAPPPPPLRSLPPPPFAVVVQDDALLCRGFFAGLRAVAAAMAELSALHTHVNNHHHAAAATAAASLAEEYLHRPRRGAKVPWKGYPAAELVHVGLPQVGS